jgi:hypothetical protein
MNFDHERVPEIIKQIPPSKLLSIDWQVHVVPEASSVYQDFGQSLYNALQSQLPLLKKYKRFTYLYPEFTYHPVISVDYFEKFCTDNKLDFQVLQNSKKMNVQKGDLYLLVSDRTLARFLDQCADKNLTIGQDAGVISYNETPMKKYVKDGISVISTDFELMGKKAAKFVTDGESIHLQIPTELKVRSSI